MTGWSIRWRLTIWNVALLTAILIGFSLVVLAMVHRHLLIRADAALSEELGEVVEEVQLSSNREEMAKQLEKRFAVHAHFHFQVTDEDGDFVFRSRFLTNLHLPRPGRPSELRGELYENVALPNLGSFRLLNLAVRDAKSRPLLFQALSPRESLDRDFRSYVWMVLTVGTLAILATLGAGYCLAGRSLAPIERITNMARRISADKLDERLPVAKPHDELRRLAMTLNEMFDRLHQSIDEMRRFTADAAHELRSPVAVLRTEAEIALRRPRSAGEYRRVVEVTLNESRRLTQLVDQLLTLSRHDAGLQWLPAEEVPVDALLQDVAQKFRSVAEEKGIELEVEQLPAWTVLGDDIWLSQLFFNLLDNAVKYTRRGGKIRLSGEADSEAARFAIEDTGIGIATEHLPRLFDRFYRVDSSRQQAGGATGLGLSICQSIVNAHHGGIAVDSELNLGTTFTVTLPGLPAEPRVGET